MSILTSDIYEWAAGGFFVVHTAYGRIGASDGGGTEIIGWNEDAGAYQSYFFDSMGNVGVHELTVDNGLWTWTDRRTARCHARFSDDGRTQQADHEASIDNGRS